MYDAAKPEAGKLYFTEAEWDAFVLGVKDGEFDLDENGKLPPVPADQRPPAPAALLQARRRGCARPLGFSSQSGIARIVPVTLVGMYPRAPRPVLDSARFGRTPVPSSRARRLLPDRDRRAGHVVVQRGPAPVLVGLLLALLPVPLLVALVLYLDRLEPEPRALLAAIFGAGAGAAVITALLGRALHTGVITTPELQPHPSVTAPVPAAPRSAARSWRRRCAGWCCWPCSPRGAPRSTAWRTGWSTGPWSGSASRWWPTCTPTRWPGTAGRGRWPTSSPGAGIFGPVFQALFASLIGLGVAYAAARPAARGRYLAIVGGLGRGGGAGRAVEPLGGSGRDRAPGHVRHPRRGTAGDGHRGGRRPAAPDRDDHAASCPASRIPRW